MGFSSFPLTATPCNCLPCGLTVIHLRLCDRKKSLGARRFGISCSGSGSTALVSNCYQLAWIISVSRVASEVCDSRWLKFKSSPLFSPPSWRLRSPLSKWFGYPLTTKLVRAKLVLIRMVCLRVYVELQLLWEGLSWFPWSWRSTQTSHARFRHQIGH